MKVIRSFAICNYGMPFLFYGESKLDYRICSEFVCYTPPPGDMVRQLLAIIFE